MVQFHQFIIKQRRAHSYPLHLLANKDESLIQYAVPSNQTVSKTKENTVRIQTTGNKKNHLIVVLTTLGNGSTLKQLVIFKCKDKPNIANKHGIVVAVQEKGWMDNEITKLLTEKVWKTWKAKESSPA